MGYRNESGTETFPTAISFSVELSTLVSDFYATGDYSNAVMGCRARNNHWEVSSCRVDNGNPMVPDYFSVFGVFTP